MATNNTIGLNIELPIYNSDGSSFHGLVLHKSTYDSIVMSLGDKITGDVYYNGNTLAVTMQEYVELDGVKFVLVTPPTVVREGMVSENSQLNGMTKYSFVFYHPMYMLGNFPFTDVAVTSSESKYLSESKVFTWIGYPDDFIAKLNKNLDGTAWIVEKSSRFPVDLDDQLSEVLSFNENTIADACKTFYDTWGAPYIVAKVESTEAAYANGKRFKVIFGLPSNEIYEDVAHQQSGTPYIFQFGKGVGLKNNSRTPRGNKIVTRISGSGSENNIPYGYPQIPWYGDSRWDYTEYEGDTINYDSDGHVTNTPKTTAYPLYMGIVGGAYVKLIKHPFTRTNLMPSIYGQTLFNKVSPYLSDGTANPDYNPNTTLIDYYDAIATQEYPYPNPIVANAPSYESHQFEDIKPELGQNVAIVDAYPVNKDMTPAQSWDDSMDDDGNYVQSYFKMQLPVLSFDLYACAAITQEMQINMRSGACLGCTFTVQVDWDDYKRNFYDEDGNFAPTGSQRDYTKYPDSTQEQITVVLQKETATFGTLMPNTYQYPVANDTFVVLGISLPLSYIEDAEERLDDEMKSYMLENNVHYFDYPLKFDEAFLRNNPYILSQIRPNSVIRFKYGNDTMQLFVKQMTVKYGEGVLPKYDITLTDNVEVVLNRIGQVAEDVEKLSSLIAILRQNYNRSVWSELAKKLSKTQDDTAAGYITMLQGLQIGASFVSDILGEGGVLRMRADGKVELVTDILYARMRAYFDSVVIREYRHESGNRIKSPAQGFNASRVENIKVVNNEETIVENPSEADYFRCYWRVDDGEKKAENQFIIGDLAFCEHSDIVNGSLVTKRYWRVVTGRNAGNTTTADGEAWIDLSNAKDGSGNPVMTTITYEGQGGTTQTKSVLSFESGSGYPEAHDDICMLGCTTDTTRQGAIIEYVSGVNAPAYQIYQGLGADATNPYLLTNKNQITIGYDSSTGKAKMDVFGDAYIGARDRSTYIEYKQGDGTAQNPPQLNIKAVMQTLPSSTYEGKSASQFVQDNQIKYDQAIQNLTNVTNDLQSQIDGEIVSWFYEGTPTLSNVPAVDWNTDVLKERHLGDLYYDVGTGVTSGFAYRFVKSEQGVYSWQYIDDTAITLALAKAAEALGLAATKAKTFTTASNTLPSPPYKTGDLWLNATGTWGSGDAAVTWNGDILKVKANINRASGDTPLISDWELAGNYLNEQDFLDWKAGQYATDLTNAANAYTNDAVANAIKSALGSALGASTLTDGGLMLTSLIYLRKLNAGGDPTQVSDYTTWGGVSGEYDANAAGGGIAAWYGGNPLDKEVLQPDEPWDGTHHYRWARSLFRFDGSGYLADGNITWSAAGSMTIRNLTTIYGSQGGGVDVNTLSSLTGIFHTETYGTDPNTELLVKPQNAFSELFINRSGTAYANYPTDKSICDYSVLNFGEMKARFITKDWFTQFFVAHYKQNNVEKTLSPNEDFPQDATDKTLESVFSFWTNYGLTALGRGIDGTHVVSVLDDLNDVDLGSTISNNDVLTYDSSTNKWTNKPAQGGSTVAALGDLTDVGISSLADKDILQYDYTNNVWKNVTLATALSGYATISQLNNYLPLTGGTLTSSNFSPIDINTTCSGEVGLRMYIGNAYKACFGYIYNDGAYIYNAIRNSYLKYTDSGTLTFEGNTVIHSGNIGSQSVSYATSAGSAPPYFANSTWYNVGDDAAIGDHDVAGAFCIRGINGTPNIRLYYSDNTYYGTVITTADIGSQSVNYASSAGNADMLGGEYASRFFKKYGTNVAQTYSSIDDVVFGESTVDGNPSGTSAASWADWNTTLLTLGENSGRTKQLIFNYSKDDIYYRRRVDNGWTSMRTIAFLDSNVASATYASSAGSVAWGNVTSKPSLFECLDWWTDGNGNNVNSLTTGTTFAYTSHNAPTNGTIAAFSCNNGSYPLQIQGQYSGENLWFRHYNGDNSTWNTWRYVIHSGNIGSQSVNYASSAGNASMVGGYSQSDFLHTTGGTLTGTLQVNSVIFGYNYANSNNAAAFVFDKPGNYYTGFGAHALQDTIWFGACNSYGSWADDYKQTWHFNGAISSVGHSIFKNDSSRYVLEISNGQGQTSSIITFNGTDHNENYQIGDSGSFCYIFNYKSYRSDFNKVTYLALFDNGHLSIGNGGNINGTNDYLYDFDGYGNFVATGGVTALSDIRHKTIVEDTRLQVNDIARMRAVRYFWNDGREDNGMHVGSIAQDWQQILPEVVLRANNDEGTLSLQYGVAALISSITIARKVVNHEQRITELERENADLKQAYSFIKNAYDYLKMDYEQLKLRIA